MNRSHLTTHIMWFHYEVRELFLFLLLSDYSWAFKFFISFTKRLPLLLTSVFFHYFVSKRSCLVVTLSLFDWIGQFCVYSKFLFDIIARIILGAKDFIKQILLMYFSSLVLYKLFQNAHILKLILQIIRCLINASLNLIPSINNFFLILWFFKPFKLVFITFWVNIFCV